MSWLALALFVLKGAKKLQGVKSFLSVTRMITYNGGHVSKLIGTLKNHWRRHGKKSLKKLMCFIINIDVEEYRPKEIFSLRNFLLRVKMSCLQRHKLVVTKIILRGTAEASIDLRFSFFRSTLLRDYTLESGRRKTLSRGCFYEG